MQMTGSLVRSPSSARRRLRTPHPARALREEKAGTELGVLEKKRSFVHEPASLLRHMTCGATALLNTTIMSLGALFAEVKLLHESHCLRN